MKFFFKQRNLTGIINFIGDVLLDLKQSHVLCLIIFSVVFFFPYFVKQGCKG